MGPPNGVLEETSAKLVSEPDPICISFIINIKSGINVKPHCLAKRTNVCVCARAHSDLDAVFMFLHIC